MKNNELLRLGATRAGVNILALWLVLLVAVLLFLFAPIALWQYLLLVGLLGLFLLLVIRLEFGTLLVELRGGTLTVSRGRLFPTLHTAPISSVLELWVLRTPLLHSCRCCIVLLHLPGMWLPLPGISDENAVRLQKEIARAEA